MVILGQLGGIPHPEQVDALQPRVVVDNIFVCLIIWITVTVRSGLLRSVLS